MFLKISQCSQGCTCARVSFSIKLQAWDQQLYWKRGSSTGNSFLVSFAKFLIKPFLYRTPLVAAFEVISFIVITGIFLYQIYYLQLPVSSFVSRYCYVLHHLPLTAWKMSVFEVFLVRIFPIFTTIISLNYAWLLLWNSKRRQIH